MKFSGRFAQEKNQQHKDFWRWIQWQVKKSAIPINELPRYNF